MRERRGEALGPWWERVEEGVEDRRLVCLLMCVRARVRAPAIAVVGVAVRVSGDVLAKR